MNKKRLGLAIGNGTVSAVLGKKGRREFEVIDQALIRPQEGHDDLAQALESLARSMDLSDVDCAVSLPASDFYFRNLKSPFVEERKIRQVLAYELEPMLALPVEKLICDFQIFQTTEGKTAILAGAASKERLIEVMDYLNPIGLDPEFILPGGLAWARQSVAASEALRTDTMALHIGSPETTLFAFRQGRLCLVRTLDRQPLDRGCEEALARTIARTVVGMADPLVEGFAPDQLLITESSPVDFQALQRALLSMKVEIELRPGGGAKALNNTEGKDGAFLADAYALAVSKPDGAQGLNFRRGSLGFEPVMARKRRRFRWTLGLAAAVGLMFMTSLAAENYRMSKTVQRIDEGMNQIFRSTFPEIRRIVDPLHQMRQNVKQFRSASGSDTGDAIPYPVTEILAYLSRQISRRMDVVLTQMVVGGEQMTLSGETDSYNTVNEMKNRMDQGGLFAQVQISTATVNRKTGRIQFTLKVGL